jgi:hypothetical protein
VGISTGYGEEEIICYVDVGSIRYFDVCDEDEGVGHLTIEDD